MGGNLPEGNTICTTCCSWARELCRGKSFRARGRWCLRLGCASFRQRGRPHDGAFCHKRGHPFERGCSTFLRGRGLAHKVELRRHCGHWVCRVCIQLGKEANDRKSQEVRYRPRQKCRGGIRPCRRRLQCRGDGRRDARLLRHARRAVFHARLHQRDHASRDPPPLAHFRSKYTRRV